MEEQSIVLLKNDQAQLPLLANNLKSIAVIGSHVDIAVGTGGGSGDTMDPVSGFFNNCDGLQFGLHELNVPIVKAIQDAAPKRQSELCRQ